MSINSIQNEIKQIFGQKEFINKMAQTMSHEKTELFKSSLLQTVSDAKLWNGTDSMSIVQSAMIAATLQLPINQNLGFAYILPYTGKNGKVGQLQIGYKGFIQLAQRSGQYKTISATAVHKNQIKSFDPLKGMEFDWEVQDKGELVGFVGYFSLVNGFEKYFYMEVKELKKHSLQYSPSARKGYGLWTDNFTAMSIKTVIKQLLSKYGPLSIDMQTAIEYDYSTIKNGEKSYEDSFTDIEIDERSELQKFIEDEAQDIRALKSIEDKIKTEAEQEAYDAQLEVLNENSENSDNNEII